MSLFVHLPSPFYMENYSLSMIIVHFGVFPHFHPSETAFQPLLCFLKHKVEGSKEKKERERERTQNWVIWVATKHSRQGSLKFMVKGRAVTAQNLNFVCIIAFFNICANDLSSLFSIRILGKCGYSLKMVYLSLVPWK